MLAACLLLLTAGDVPEARPYPQLPEARECLRKSWDAWQSATYLQQWSWYYGSNDDTAVLISRGRLDSWAWYDAKIMQDPATAEAERCAAHKRLSDYIGADRLFWGWMPPVAKPPAGWEKVLP